MPDHREASMLGSFRPVCGLGLAALLALMPVAPLGSQEQPKISVEVRAVNVLATVRDKHGAIVTNLGKDDFLLSEDNRPQTIAYFSRESDLPLTLGLLVDTSGSQTRVLPEERSASSTFLDQMLRENKDQAFMIHFDREVELLQDLTSSHQKLESALGLLDAEKPDNSRQGNSRQNYPQRGAMGGGTALYDAVFLASDEVIKNQQGRKALVVFSDGVDHGSKVTLERAIESAQRADTVVYSILFADEQLDQGRGGFGGGGFGGIGRRSGGQRFPQQDRIDGKKILQRISAETGGRLFETSKKQPIDEIYGQIEEELRSQYSIGYTPDRTDLGAGYRKIHLTTKQKDLIVQARDGYYADR